MTQRYPCFSLQRIMHRERAVNSEMCLGRLWCNGNSLMQMLETVSFYKTRRLGSCQTEINRCREHNIQGYEVVKMRNSNINVGPRGRSLGDVRRHTLTLLQIHQEPSGCHGKGEFLQYMTAQICHVLPIRELPI